MIHGIGSVVAICNNERTDNIIQTPLTKPKFVRCVTKSLLIAGPVAIEINRPVHTTLEHLQYKLCHGHCLYELDE